MENEFYNVVSEARRYELSYTNIDVLKGALTRWEKLLRKTDVEILIEFENIHWTEITRVIHILRAINDPLIRGAHDRIFKNIFGRKKSIPSSLTVLFGKFIRGITYFQNQNAYGMEIPIYHRLYSCGTGEDAFRNTFQRCTADMNVRTRIETCYIERMIYDYMYCKLVLLFPNTGTEEQSQDKKHMDRLALTKGDFETCFPNLRIEIDMEFNNMNWPIELIIHRYIRDKLVSKETYRRSIVFGDVFGDRIYEDAVEAIKETDQYRYFRVQRSVYRPAWKRI